MAAPHPEPAVSGGPPARTSLRTRVALVVAFGALMVGGGALAVSSARHRARGAAIGSLPAPPPASRVVARTLHVPRTTTAPEVDGKLEEPLWRDGAARSGPFLDAAGKDARPYSEARFAWAEADGGALYVALYAADIDLEAQVQAVDGPVWLDDSFRLTFPGAETSHVLEGSVLGTLADAEVRNGRADPSWSSGARLAADTDGTPNDPHDDDEEWTLEWRIPLAALAHRAVPAEHILVSVRRCDSPKHGPRACGALGEPDGIDLVLDP